MSYLFIENLFQREKFVLFKKKKMKIERNSKKPKKSIFSGFFGWVLLGFFGWVFWVGFLLPTLVDTEHPGACPINHGACSP
jgi:hypothetical protein